MRRRVRFFGTVLILGLVTTVIVAWSFATVPNKPFNWAKVGRGVAQGSNHETFAQRRHTPGTIFVLTTSAEFGDGDPSARSAGSLSEVVPLCMRSALIPSLWPGQVGAKTPVMRYGWAYGWPWPALWCVMHAAPNLGKPNSYWTYSAVSGWVPVPSWKGFNPMFLPADPPVIFPYRPCWAGLLGDTMLYSGIWCGILLLPPAIRRLRVGPGQCRHCRYNLAGLPAGTPCPECGTPAGTLPACAPASDSPPSVSSSA